MTKEEYDELLSNILHEVTEARRQGRKMYDEDKQACNEAYTDEHGVRHPDQAYVEGRDTGYLKALDIVKKEFDKVMYPDKFKEEDAPADEKSIAVFEDDKYNRTVDF